MRLLFFGDAHGDKTTGGLDRGDEVGRAYDQVYAHAVARRVRRAIFLGDLCDPDGDTSLMHRAIAQFVDFAKRCGDAGILLDCLVGNHDVIDDGKGSHTLMALARAGLPGVRVHASPGNTLDHEERRIVEFVWLPYGRYDAAHYVLELARSKRLGLKGGALVVAGHTTKIPQVSAPGSETLDMPRGSDLLFPMDAVLELKKAGGYDRAIFINGHFHNRLLGGPVLTPGSLARLTHGEEAHHPGFLVVDV